MTNTETTIAPFAPSTLERVETVATRWRVIAPEGMDTKTLTNEMLWTHNARLMSVGDIIEVVAIEGTWFAELYVLDKGTNWARVAELRFIRFDGAVADASDDVPEGYVIEWKGPHKRYVVIRSLDRMEMNDRKLQTKAEAVEWLQNHVRQRAA